jgi:uncharacterized protein (TIGR00369 family)
MQNFNQSLGIRPGDEENTVLLDTQPEHQIISGVIHFAVLTTLAEVSAATAVGGSVVPASVTVNLLRPAPPGQLVGKGRVVKRGRQLAVAEGEVYGGEKLVAKAVVTFAVLG